MAIGEVSPKDAHELCTKDQAIFVDVRSVEEFGAGHPPGALNVPLMLSGGMFGRMQPNADFVSVAQTILPKDRKLVVSCAAGVRSLRACQMLEQNGWPDLLNLSAGWNGARDMFGRVSTPGWEAAGLPVEKGQTAGHCYEDLKKKKG